MRYAVTIPEKQTRELLRQAVRAHAQVLIEPTGEPERAIRGFLTSGDQEVLLIELSVRDAEGVGEMLGRCCDVQVFLGDRYLFHTRIVRGPQWHNGSQIALQTPQTLHACQRRRFWRAALASSSTVELTWSTEVSAGKQGRPVATAGRPDRRTTRAALLNLSCAGLACKVDAEPAGSLPKGTPLSVTFVLPDSPQPFQFEAEVCNVTPATDGRCLVGVQFHVSAGSAEATRMRRRLQDTLYRPSVEAEADPTDESAHKPPVPAGVQPSVAANVRPARRPAPSEAKA
jgi:hypothetical protein